MSRQRVYPLCDKPEKLVIGLMSGTSCDGIDAALVRISGSYTDTVAREEAFVSVPYEPEVRERLLALVKGDEGGSRELMRMSFLLGSLFLAACIRLCESAHVSPGEIDLIGSHGHTVFHQPSAEDYLGHKVRGTMQIGDVSALASYFSCPVVSDFRVRDFAEGGMGAPLVPYTEYILYSDPDKDVAYQNIGGIGNVTLLKRGGGPDEVVAFDTGPGNVLIDALISVYTQGRELYDDKGAFAARGSLSPVLQEFFLADEYLNRTPPKTTGREYYDSRYVARILDIAGENHIPPEDVMCTVTWFTACSIVRSFSYFPSFHPQRLIVAGGGSHNELLMSQIAQLLPDTQVVTGDEAGIRSDSKEAVAFAVLANETIAGNTNCLTGATGAARASVLGKIQF